MKKERKKRKIEEEGTGGAINPFGKGGAREIKKSRRRREEKKASCFVPQTEKCILGNPDIRRRKQEKKKKENFAVTKKERA